MAGYFDLNHRRELAKEKFMKENGLIEFNPEIPIMGDADSSRLKTFGGTRGGGGVSTPKIPEKDSRFEPENSKKLTLIEQISMYIFTFFGVFLSSTLLNYLKDGSVSFTISIGVIVISLIIALAIIPYIYQNIMFVDKPKIVQWGIFLQTGLSWPVILNGVVAFSQIT
ncbi:hypothetical protein [Methanolacinia paynteri]|uniref:hypothetical protein n=1 Tax=Methanolacinia paynteri TaxID=230356 RepID=UPI00064F7AC4|nr:hypothetical protein [Methanolacinia paynteri]